MLSRFKSASEILPKRSSSFSVPQPERLTLSGLGMKLNTRSRNAPHPWKSKLATSSQNLTETSSSSLQSDMAMAPRRQLDAREILLREGRPDRPLSWCNDEQSVTSNVVKPKQLARSRVMTDPWLSTSDVRSGRSGDQTICLLATLFGPMSIVSVQRCSVRCLNVCLRGTAALGYCVPPCLQTDRSKASRNPSVGRAC